MLVIALYSKEASKEAERLMPSRNYIGANDGFVRNKLPEDFVYTMQQVYKHDSVKREKIRRIIYGKAFDPNDHATPLEQYYEDLKAMEDLPRAKYVKVFREVGKYMWEFCKVPTVEDIARLIEGDPSEELEAITEFLDNKDKLMGLITRDSSIYSEEESAKHIVKVMSSNSTDISEAGWFYKKLISSADDMKVTHHDCGSEGEVVSLEGLTEADYNYQVRSAYVAELGEYAEYQYKYFAQKVQEKGLKEVTVRKPLTCKLAPERQFCEKCVGKIKINHEESFMPVNIGIFTTLMVTEHATQASLDSMNKGVSENLNVLIESPMEKKRMTWEEAQDAVRSICAKIGWIGVQERFYQIAIMSRFYKKDDYYVDASLQHSFKHHADALGEFIYSPSMANLIKFMNEKSVKLTSMKSKIMFDIYEDDQYDSE